MIDAHAASMGEVGAHHFDKGPIAVGLEPPGRECADPPVLPGTVENIRRGANAQRSQYFFLSAPGLAAATIGAYRQITDQANLHSGAAGRYLSTFQATGDQPLAERVVTDLVSLLTGEAINLGAVRVTILLGPVAPVLRVPIGIEKGGMQRFEAAVVLQRLPTSGSETVEIRLLRIATFAEVLEQLAQQSLPGLADGRPVDQLQLFQSLQFFSQAAGFD